MHGSAIKGSHVIEWCNVLTRRKFLYGATAVGVTGTGFGGYAFAIEPYRLVVRRYNLKPVNWPQGLNLRIAALADLHACDPWMPIERVQAIVEQTNGLGADFIALLGDYVGSERITWRPYDKALWANALGQLRAPLGVHAVLGNHDWWDDKAAQERGSGPVAVRFALEQAGIAVYENDAVALEKEGSRFWLCGLGDQWAFYGRRDPKRADRLFNFAGVDDLAGTLAQVSDDSPVIMLVHEPDIFAEMPDRVALTLAGHTHGGQVQLMGFAPIVPSRYGNRYIYGHVQEGERHLVVSGGIGCSGLPVRFGRPPEIVVIDIGA